MPFGVNKVTGKPGPSPNSPRDGDAEQARQRVNVEVRTGYRPSPNDIPCHDCGHVYSKGERRHEYDHYLGYSAEHHLDVQSVCTTCHSKRHQSDICKRGHAINGVAANGRRFCRECRRMRDRGRRDAEYWRNYRAKRREASCGRKHKN